MFINDWSVGKDSTIDPAYLSQQQKKEDAILVNKNITINGTYNATDDEADGYSTINVEVANIYTNEDNGKVVFKNQLVAQTAREAEITENGIYDTTLNNSIAVNIPTPTSEIKNGAVIRDYDGSIIASYTPTQFAALSAYPAQPVHTGLTGQGYNWTLADAKDYVTKYGYIEVGATYITDDGKTRLYITLTEGRLSPVLALCPNGTLTIDWGDGSPTETMTGTSVSTLVYLPHTYSDIGDYVVVITPSADSSFAFGQRDNSSTIFCKSSNDARTERLVYKNILKSLELGSGVTNIDTYAFDDCQSLTSITIPNSIISIGNNAFVGCYSLTSITIPNSVTNINHGIFQNCYALKSVTISNSITSIGNSTFSHCSSLDSITIPSGVTSIGNSTFYYCYSLTLITIPNSVTVIDTYAFSDCHSLKSITIPNSVTSIGTYAFQYCYSLNSITIPSDVTSIGNYAFSGCHSLASITMPNNITSIGICVFQNCDSLESIIIPNSVTSIGNSAFRNCYSLASIIIPSGVTSIGKQAFQYCYALDSIIIPNSVTSIDTQAFQSCCGFAFIRFLKQAPPTINGSNTFLSIPNDCIIYAPALVVNLYMDGTNYPDKSTYTYIGYATYPLGDTLPDKTTDETYNLTWYATVDDLKTQTNPITVGNGNEVYATATVI